MIPSTAAQAYLVQETSTWDAVTRIARLFDGAVAYVGAASESLAQGDVLGGGRSVGRALEILGALRASLDMERGGEAAGTFDRFYGLLIARLVRARTRNDLEMLGQVQDSLREVAEAWTSASRGPVQAPAEEEAHGGA